MSKNFIIRNKNTEGQWETLYPQTVAAQVITTDEAKFVTAEQIALWDAKASTDLATATTAGLLSPTDKGVIDNIDKTVSDAIAAVVDAAPSHLDTIRELAEAITEHGDEYEALLTLVGEKATKAELTAGLATKLDIAEFEKEAAKFAVATDVAKTYATKAELEAQKVAAPITVVGTTEPTDAKAGDFWYEIV